MKLRTIWICVLSVTSVSGCSFERTPVARDQEISEAKRLWSSDLGGQDEWTSRRVTDASVSDKSKSQSGSKNSSGGSKVDSPGKPSQNDAGARDDDQDDAGREPERKPTQCGAEFCPLTDDQVGACCTTQGDIDQHGAQTASACGLDLRRVDEAQYGQGCWQRDQLGIIDARCPARGSEPGCCADDGLCGTSNPERHLGCYHAKGAELRSCRQETEPVGTVCDPRGSYGLRIAVDAAWNGRPGGLAALTDDGRGKIYIYMLLNVDDVDAASGSLETRGRVCGVTLPPFYSSTLCESYQAIFPESIWESSYLPVPNVGGTYQCDADGCVMSLWPTTYVFGIRMDNLEAPWPTAQQTRSLRCPNLPDEECFVDEDNDGEPGISILVQTEGQAEVVGACRMYPLRGAPLSDSIAAIFGGVRRADRLHVGIRTRAGGSARFRQDCGSATGSAVVEYVNSRSTGCYVQPGTFDFGTISGPAGAKEPCRESEANFIDLSMPMYQVLGAGEAPVQSRMPRDETPSAGPTIGVVRLPPEIVAGCADVRAMQF